MTRKLLSILLIITLSSFQTDSFKNSQLKYSRVRQAYKDKENSMLTLLQDKQIDIDKLKIYLRAFKNEEQMELWGKNDSDTEYSLIKTYEVCNTSGNLGPKRQQGDLQIPEGFYHIDRFNPYSSYYLSLGINYPNKSDRILGVKGQLGGDIFIHGACVTIGCLPITDDQIKELYIFCTEARNNGQTKIPITIFPSKLSEDEFKRLSETYKTDTDKIALWTDLKRGYEIFNQKKEPPSIGFLASGRHRVN
ncbi:L,D-transpeptidase family protein [Flammeovirga agarivorans]|uniref:L,D-transpeptidase family protein n=1 Tax=Flammeovirga agarivorans TaxID=2726742 RepID=A0A7X8XVJ7_9BACT|nr:L,D-transpeptidase family protein [Flammeovirga agarivorans]NLR91413.1 L,D-transpeptidase family protein [Flammeovirga agarivorans]